MIDIPIVVLMKDNGDGEFTAFIYNTEQEMLDNHPDAPLTSEREDEILSGKNGYEDGRIVRAKISLKKSDNGEYILANAVVLG